MVSGNPDYYECIDSIRAQMRLELGSDKCTVDVLAKYSLVRRGLRLDLKGVTRPVLAKRRLGFKRQMLDVNDRPAAGAPSCEQIGDPLFCIGIVARSPARVFEALLNVDEE